MRILLTGAVGKLSQAIRRLGSQHQFVLIDVHESVESAGGIRASVTDRAAVRRAAAGCDAIIHTAAMHGLFYGKASNQEFILTNVVGAENLFEAALEHGIKRLVMSSTLEVVIGSACDAWGTGIIDDDTPPRPDWIYPLTKLMVEQMSEFYVREHGLEVLNLRYGNILPWPVEQMAFQLLARGLHTDEYARANLLAVEKMGLTCHTLNLAADTPLTRPDVTAGMKDPWSVLDKYWPGSAECLKARNIEPNPKYFFPVVRIDRARQVLGWQPQITFADFLRHHGWTGQPMFE